MDKKELEQLGLPEVKSYKEVNELTQQWDLVQSQVAYIEIVIVDFTRITAFDKPGLAVNCFVDGEKKTVLINGTVLMKDLERFEPELPMLTTITDEGQKYYYFT